MYVIIPTQSRTDAEKIRRIAKENRIMTAVVSIDPSMTRHGCSVGIKVMSSYSSRLIQLIEARGIQHGEILERTRK